MRKSKKKRKNKFILNSKNKSKKQTIIPVLLAIGLLSLFSETMRTVPAGAKSESFKNFTFETPSFNSTKLEKKIINNATSFIVKKNNSYLIEENILTDEEIKFNDESKKSLKEDVAKKTIVAKVPEKKKKSKETKIIKKEIVDVSKVKEKIKVASAVKLTQADTSTKTITIDGEEKIIPGSADKNITYIEILQNPNDLDLNLKYARQQGKAGNFKQTIATLERLNMIYPDNVEIKLYLLSVLVQADAPDKALIIIEEIKSNEDLSPEDLLTVADIEEQMKARKAPKLWNFFADLGAGFIQNNNVNSVSKNRLQVSSNEIIPFNSAMHDRTYNSNIGVTALRRVGEASSFMINAGFADSRQVTDTADDFDSYSLSFAFDTTIGNQSISPSLSLSKTDNGDDADNFAAMVGIGGFFSAGEDDQHSISYGYSLSDSKNNRNMNDTTADETNAIGHSVSIGHDYMVNDIVSTSTGLGYSISEAKVGSNDFHTYDFSLRLNLAFPWAYISIGDALSFNDYIHQDTSVVSNIIRSDYTNTMDISVTKALGDFIPILDPNKNLFINLAYEKIFSEANIMNYDYIADSYSVSFTKGFQLNK